MYQVCSLAFFSNKNSELRTRRLLNRILTFYYAEECMKRKCVHKIYMPSQSYCIQLHATQQPKRSISVTVWAQSRRDHFCSARTRGLAPKPVQYRLCLSIPICTVLRQHRVTARHQLQTVTYSTRMLMKYEKLLCQMNL
jgi:hypothetical protein